MSVSLPWVSERMIEYAKFSLCFLSLRLARLPPRSCAIAWAGPIPRTRPITFRPPAAAQGVTAIAGRDEGGWVGDQVTPRSPATWGNGLRLRKLGTCLSWASAPIQSRQRNGGGLRR